MPNAARHVYSYSSEGRHQQDHWLLKHVPVNYPFDVWLKYPASDVSVFASVEPVSGGQFLVAYTVRCFDSRAAKRSGIWHYIKCSGLDIFADPEHVSESSPIGKQILGAIYAGTHQEIEDSFLISSSAVH